MIWYLDADSRDELIERAVIVALGMSLVFPVTVRRAFWPAPQDRLTSVSGDMWQVFIEDTSGDAARIVCANAGEAAQLRDDVYLAIQATLAELPPFASRHTIAVQP